MKPPVLARLWSWLRALVRRDRFEDGMSEELRFHLDAYAADLVRGGLSPAEAHRRARMEFGNLDTIKDDCRQSSGLRLLDATRRETRHAFRLLRRSPGFTLTALATIAVCLGANLTIFSVVDAVLLKPLPFPQPDRLMTVYNTYPRAGVPNDGSSLTNYYERRGQIAAFSHVAAYRDGTVVIGESGGTERVAITRVSPEYFETLGLPLRLGRSFTEEETTYATADVAVITDGYWRQQFGADLGVLGRTLRVNGTSVTVIGVLPASFRFLSSRARLYLPLASNPEEHSEQQRHSGNSDLIARLAADVSVADAQLEIDAHNDRLEQTNPMAPAMAEAGFRSVVTPLRADHVASVRPILWSVQAAALCLLVIGVVNLLNLLLMRAGGRTRERAVRVAIGASRGQLVASAVVETGALTVVGGALGLVVAAVGIRLLGVLGAEHLPLGTSIGFDPRLAGVALAASAVLGVALGLPMGWWSLRGWGGNPMRLGSRGGTASRGTERIRQSLIVTQVALAFVLLSGAGLLGLSLQRVLDVPAGFRPDHVLTGKLSISRANFANESAVLTFVDELRSELGRRPGVTAVGLSTNVPLSGVSNKSAVTVKDYVRPPGESLRGHYAYSVDGDVFDALGMTLVAGRLLTAADSRRPARVAVVDEDFARHYWPDGGALGQRIWSGSGDQPDDQAFSIVGIVKPMKQADLSEGAAQGAAYFPFGHRMDGQFFVVMRTTQEPTALAATMQRVVRDLSPDLPVSDLMPMTDRVSASLIVRRSPALLAGIFSVVALLLTAIGTYGVLSYAVALRRKEIGLRMALGATPADVRGRIVARAAGLFAAGAALGVVGAWFEGQALQAVLFDVPRFHVPTVLAATLVLAAAAVAASVLPSHRAARISPLEAMADDA